jgi:hypothetical protein
MAARHSGGAEIRTPKKSRGPGDLEVDTKRCTNCPRTENLVDIKPVKGLVDFPP